VRFPRILRWRSDKTPADADRLDQLFALIDAAARENPARPARVVDVEPSLFDAADDDHAV
jgi:hypothetical protein